jgi:hypothetical protein
MKAIVFFLLLVFFPRLSICADEPPFFYLLRNTGIGDDWLLEFEFAPNGRLNTYNYSSGDFYEPAKGEEVFPFLFIESWSWKQENGKLLVGREAAKREMSYNKDGNYFQDGDFAFDEVKELKFFSFLERLSKKPEDEAAERAKVPFRYLRTSTPAGFTEYAFCSDGKLFAYYDLERASENDKSAPLDSYHTRFSVERLVWEKQKNEILVHHGSVVERMEILDGGKKITSDRGDWKQVDHLEFVPSLYSYCGRTLPESPR